MSEVMERGVERGDLSTHPPQASTLPLMLLSWLVQTDRTCWILHCSDQVGLTDKSISLHLTSKEGKPGYTHTHTHTHVRYMMYKWSGDNVCLGMRNPRLIGHY